MNTQTTPKHIIDALGGTSETARICDVSPSAVSQWKKKGRIPKPWLRFLREAHPEVFAKLEPPQPRRRKTDVPPAPASAT